MTSENSPSPNKVFEALRWLRLVLVALAIGFTAWFFFAVYTERNGGESTDRIGNSADDSKRLRTEVRSWFRKTFPESAARADERYGFFEYEAAEIAVSNQWVFLAHGLDEPGNLWADLAPELADEGYRVFEFRYPNDQPIHESSQFFDEQLMALLETESSGRSPEEVHLMGHSMGGLVLRNFLTHPDLMAARAMASLPTIRSFIQIATPNHGSWLSTYRFPVELRDHLFKDYGVDAVLGMIWDGAGEAQIDLKPESAFLAALNSRPFPKAIHWVGIAGTGSPVDLNSFQTSSWFKDTILAESAGDLNTTFPELFKGTGDGCVSIESLQCPEMDAVHFVDATHRTVVRDSSGQMPPAIPIILQVLQDLN